MRVRALRVALLPIGVAFGVAVEWAFYDASLGPALTAADLAVGCVLIACGAVAWQRRPESRVGPIMALAGSSWFLGNVAGPLLSLHRGPLVQLHLSYPTGRLRSLTARAVVAAAYLDAAIAPLARNDVLTLALSAAVALTAVRVFLGTSGPARKSGGPALATALAFAGVLALGAAERLAAGQAHRDAVLWAYDTVIACAAVVLLRDLLRGRWTEAIVTGLVVDLGTAAESGTLRGKLAHALGDPSLVIGYRLETGSFVDEAGRPVQVPAPGSRRTVTPLVDGGEHVAVLVHDEALLADRQLVESVAAAARMAVTNAGLQAEARAKAAELEASRRRIVETADAQRRRIQQELRLGAGKHLETVASLLARVPAATTLEKELAEARRELEEFARGVHPATLTDAGLLPALAQLAQRSPIPVELNGWVGRLPEPVETALFFVCSEALANTAKHASASGLTIDVHADGTSASVAVADDGVGGADPSAGSGLRGLADRVETVGGSLRVWSPAGGGTRIVAEIPLSEPA